MVKKLKVLYMDLKDIKSSFYDKNGGYGIGIVVSLYF